MKTTSLNESLRSGNVVININYYEGSSTISVNANQSASERTTTVNLEYDAKSGSRETEVKDFSAPFDNAFYSALDAQVLKFVSTVSTEEEE